MNGLGNEEMQMPSGCHPVISSVRDDQPGFPASGRQGKGMQLQQTQRNAHLAHSSRTRDATSAHFEHGREGGMSDAGSLDGAILDRLAVDCRF
jgi:hypothetical protein